MAVSKTGTEATREAAKQTPVGKEVTGTFDTVEVTVVTAKGKEETFTCPAKAEDVPYRFFLKMEDEKPLSAFAAMLGEDGLNRMDRIGATQADFNQFIEKWTEASGLGNDSD